MHQLRAPQNRSVAVDDGCEDRCEVLQMTMGIDDCFR